MNDIKKAFSTQASIHHPGRITVNLDSLQETFEEDSSAVLEYIETDIHKPQMIVDPSSWVVILSQMGCSTHHLWNDKTLRTTLGVFQDSKVNCLWGANDVGINMSDYSGLFRVFKNFAHPSG